MQAMIENGTFNLADFEDQDLEGTAPLRKNLNKILIVYRETEGAKSIAE